MHFIVFVMCTAAYNLFGAKAVPLIDTNLSLYSVKHDVETLDRKVFQLPSNLNSFKEIHITGTFKNSTERLTVNLVTANKETRSPDLNNIACQVRVDFKSASVTINSIVAGEHRPPKDENADPDDWFSTLEFTIALFKNEPMKNIGLELQKSSTMNSCDLEHSLGDIEYLTVGGDYDEVKSLHFVLDS